MIYNGKIQADHQRAKERLIWLLNKGKRFEITEKRRNRTDPQNNYLHLILSYYALEIGETLEYIKQEIFKKIVNADIFLTERVNPKTGEIRPMWRSTADINTKEMTVCIERYRNYCLKEAGVYIPSPNEKQFLDHIQNEIELQKQWL